LIINHHPLAHQSPTGLIVTQSTLSPYFPLENPAAMSLTNLAALNGLRCLGSLSVVLFHTLYVFGGLFSPSGCLQHCRNIPFLSKTVFNISFQMTLLWILSGFLCQYQLLEKKVETWKGNFLILVGMSLPVVQERVRQIEQGTGSCQDNAISMGFLVTWLVSWLASIILHYSGISFLLLSKEVHCIVAEKENSVTSWMQDIKSIIIYQVYYKLTTF
jgi:hypothetical protein